ncbi:soil-associated protein, TIGR03435 family [Granulicella rosea]|uniref:Soil-associated protein, TIGR03435 family n=1 Tax=Granulicella rosea TaxID=474952 RepID=A0A239M796_9BACT|nr:TIGR03435 family protein [Granulicella rosea]SNT38002.1 soil-associated protein, TIGR03435 family [Granulicella rosea]
MKRLLLWIVVLVTFLGAGLGAQESKPDTKDITGTWQGTLAVTRNLRMVIKFAKADGVLKATIYSIDLSGAPIAATSVSQVGTTIRFTAVAIGGSYVGKLSADGNTIAGSYTQGASVQPFELTRATAETAWEIPAVAPPPKLMAADADPSFEVATIKPNNTTADSTQGMYIRGRNFSTAASSVVDLLAFAYGVHARQVSGGPSWLDKDRYDIAGVPDTEGVPSTLQVKMMVRKLLADRFQLKFHYEKSELPAYVLTVGKGGPKLTPTQATSPLPGLGFSPGVGGISLIARNANLGDLSAYLQRIVLDRPVVDHTGVAGRYDFSMTFAPDDSEFGGNPPRPPANGSFSAAGLFEAMQQQLGLRLDPEKTQVDVIVIDKVEKPSEN